MNEFEIISASQEDTKKIANRIAKRLNRGDIIVLTGDLGSGKTKFVEGFLSYFHMQDEISSPTFNIVNEYQTPSANIYHFDVYRLEDSDEFYAIGGEEYFENGICLIEWGETMKEVLPQNYIQITFTKDNNDDNKRYLQFKAYGKCNILLNEIKEDLN